MLMASMLAMVLLAASPAMAQDGGDAADDSIGGAGGDVTETQYNTEICQNIIGDITVGQYNDASQEGGDDVAVQDNDGDDSAQLLSQDEAQAIAQENNTTIEIVQQCATGAGVNVIGPAADDFNGDGVVNGGDDINGDGVVGAADAEAAAGDAEAAAAAGAEAEAEAAAGDDAEAGAVAVLPDTGGASLFTLAAGALLVAGGLLARRIVR